MRRNLLSVHIAAKCSLLVLVVLILLAFAVPVFPQDASGVAPADKTSMLCFLEDSFSSIAQRAQKGVVSVRAVQRASTEGVFSGTSARSLDDFFNRYLNREMGLPPSDAQDEQNNPPDNSESPSVTATGSGSIVRRQGNNFYVLTNYHVVENAYQVTIGLWDDSQVDGIVVGVDPLTDLAVVRIASPKLSEDNVVPLGDSNKVEVGSWALAIGNPFGFEHTMTVGVVSALHRELEDEETLYPDLIQTDAAINKGNSGGPLLDIEGKIIGVNAAIASPTGGFIGLGFAIPINTATAVLDELITDGRVVRGWLGVGIQELDPVLQEYYKTQQGVLVASVDEKGPASKAGLASEDIIVQVGDMPITEVRQLQKLVTSTAPGTTLPVIVIRDNARQSMQVQIGLSPYTPNGRPTPPPPRKGAGIESRTLTGDLAKRIGIKGTKGVIVIDVSAGSAPEDAGLEEGDIVTAFNGRQISEDSQFDDMIQNTPSNAVVVLRVIRKGLSRMIGFRMP